MCRQYASSTCSSPAGVGEDDQLGAERLHRVRAAVAEPVRQPQAVPAAREPVRRRARRRWSRTTSPSHTHRLEHVLVLWRWAGTGRTARGRNRRIRGAEQPAVIAAVADLLPVFRQRAQETEDNRVVPAESVKALAETGFFRLLQPASYGGLEADPIAFFTAVRLIASACGSTGWVASVARRAPVAARPVPGAGPGGSLGRRPGHPDVLLLRADRAGARRRRRVPAGRPVELLLRLRPRELGAARRDRHRRRRQAGRLLHVPAARQRLRRSTTCGTRSGCAARAATTSWWTAPSSPSTGR